MKRDTLTFSLIRTGLVVLSMLVGVVFTVNAQKLDSCGADVPYFNINLTGAPDSVWSSPNIARKGQCCSALNNENCISFELTLDSQVAGIQIDMVGADPSGSLFYDIDCQGNYPGGTLKCIAGVGPHKITFCKPGSNKNIYIITSIPKPTFPHTDTVRIGCSKRIEVLGLEDSTISWNSITGGSGLYNDYLSCTNCAIPSYAPDTNAPAFVDYEICGFPIADECGYIFTVCDTVRIYNFDPLEASYTPSPAYFCDFGPGSGVTLKGSGSGGDGNYSFEWLNSADSVLSTDSNYFAEIEGSYTLRVSDGLNSGTCPSESFTSSVIVAEVPVVSAGSSQKVCANDPETYLNGTVTNAEGGKWSGGGGTFYPADTVLNASYEPTSAEINAGQTFLYLASTGAGSGCPDVIDSVLITFPDSLKSVLNDTSTLCNNGTATISPSVSGGIMPYTYTWSTGASDSSITVGEGAYSVMIRDSLGCVTSNNVVVSTPALLEVTISSTDATTNGGSDGTATVVPSGGTPGYTYLWSPSGGTEPTDTGLSYGVHSVAVMDTNGCTIIASVVVNEPRCASFSASVSYSNLQCYGFNNATATVFPTGGTLPYSYSWSNGDTTQTADSLGAGVYTVTVTDSNDCVEAQTINVLQPSQITNTMFYTDVTYLGGNDGSATANPFGGVPSYNFDWENGDTTQTADSLTSGVYTVNIEDDSGCVFIDSVQINEPPCDNFRVNINKTDVTCGGYADGRATLQIVHGTPPYNILWSDGQDSTVAIDLAANTYTVNVVDSNNCTTFGSITISEPLPLNLGLAPTDISCYGKQDGTIDATVSGGVLPYSYSWSNTKTSEDVAYLEQGFYIITVTDGNDCIIKDTAQIQEPSALFANTNQTNVTCNGGNDASIDLTVFGGIQPYNILWSSGETTEDRDSLFAGGYSVTIKDANNCLYEESIVVGITEPDSIQIDSFAVACPIPGSGVAQVNITPTGGSGPYQISYDNGITYGDEGVYDTILATGSAYSIMIQDTNGCISHTPDTISINSDVVIDSINFEKCFPAGLSTSLVEVFPNGGTNTTYAISYDSGSVYGVYGDYDTNLVLNQVYYAIAQDTLGCVSLPSEITIPDSVEVTASITSNYNGQDVTCFNATDAVIHTSVSGGDMSYSYLWTGGGTNDSLDNVGAGTYQVVVTDGNGCQDSTSITVSQPDTLIATASIISNYNGQDVSCFGSTDGEAVVSAVGGTTSYSYVWSNADNDDTLNSVGAGYYDVTVTDANGCSDTASVTLSEPDSLVATAAITSNYNGQDVSCFGSTDGEAVVSTVGGTTSYSYVWSNADNDDTLNSVGAGYYDVTVTDANGCTDTSSVTLSEPDSLVATAAITSNYNGQDVSCFGSTDGEAVVSAVGGTTSYSYVWSNADNDDTLNSVGAGYYDVTVTDANGCTDTSSVTLSEPDSLVATAAITSNYNGQDVSCFGSTDGEAVVSVVGGTTIYNYVWSNADNDDTLNSVGAGYYDVTVTDANGCTDTSSVTLSEPDSLVATAAITSNYNGQDVSCFGSTDGEAMVVTTGGTLNYSYLWGGTFVTNDTLSSVGAGSYTVFVTDANGCSDTASVTLSEPDSLVATAAITSNYNGQDVSCFGFTDGEAVVSAVGGTTAYSYVWSNADNDDTLNDVGAGYYDVTVTDANGCSDTSSVTLSEPDSLVATAAITSNYNGQDVSCFGSTDGEAVVSVVGGTTAYSYVWSNADNDDTLNDVGAGYYDVTVTDANGCTDTSSVTLSEPDSLVATAAITSNYNGQDVSCFGSTDGEAVVSVVGGTTAYNYVWSNADNDNTLNSVGSGYYDVTVTDANGCSDTASVTLSEPDTMIATASIISDYTGQHVSCNGATDGEAMVVVTGGTLSYSYLWGGTFVTNDTLSSVGAGSYTVFVTDVNGCSDTSSVTIIEPDILAISLTVSSDYNGQDIRCFGEENGAIASSTNGGTKGYSYLWSNTEITADISNLGVGVYSVMVTDTNGCTDTAAITLLQPDTLIATASITSDYNGQDVSCYGSTDGEAAVNVTGGTTTYTYSWSNSDSDAILDSVGAGYYDITVTDINGCSDTASVTIMQPDSFSFSSVQTNVSCNGGNDGSIDLTVIGATPTYTYYWEGPAGFEDSIQDISGIAAGTYNVTVTDVNGCVDSSYTIIVDPSAISLDYNLTRVKCYGDSTGSIDLIVTGGTPGYTYSWNNGATTEDLSELVAGSYTVTVTDDNGCFTSVTGIITQPDSFYVTGVSTNVSCYGYSNGSVDIALTGGVIPYLISWSNGATTEDIDSLMAGTYTVTITDSNNCQVLGEYEVSEPDSLEGTISSPVLFNGHNVSYFGSEDGAIDVEVNGGTSPYNYTWSTGDVSEDLAGVGAGGYTVNIVDEQGCQINLDIVLTQPDELDMPTGYSPNGDGDNDYFVVKGIEAYPDNLFTVFNRWGNLVYEKENYQNEWEGKNLNGEPLPDGTYFVILNINDGEIILKGYVDMRR